MDIPFFEELRRHFIVTNFYFTRHANKEAEKDGLTITEVWEAITGGESIEDYPDDPRGHSCLVFGTSRNGKNIHACCSIRAGKACVITVYIPDGGQWIDFRKRR
jgi:hypothetical protein